MWFWTVWCDSYFLSCIRDNHAQSYRQLCVQFINAVWRTRIIHVIYFMGYPHNERVSDSDRSKQSSGQILWVCMPVVHFALWLFSTCVYIFQKHYMLKYLLSRVTVSRYACQHLGKKKYLFNSIINNNNIKVVSISITLGLFKRHMKQFLYSLSWLLCTFHERYLTFSRLDSFFDLEHFSNERNSDRVKKGRYQYDQVRISQCAYSTH